MIEMDPRFPWMPARTPQVLSNERIAEIRSHWENIGTGPGAQIHDLCATIEDLQRRLQSLAETNVELERRLYEAYATIEELNPDPARWTKRGRGEPDGQVPGPHARPGTDDSGQP